VDLYNAKKLLANQCTFRVAETIRKDTNVGTGKIEIL